MVSCNSTTHATCSLTLMAYKYIQLQMSFTTPKLNWKVSYKTPLFFHNVISNIFHLLSNLDSIILDVNSWKVVKRMTKQYYQSCKEFRVEIFSMSFSYYYKIQHGGKNLVLVNKVIIIFTMQIMHKYLASNFIFYLCTMIINQIVVKLDK